MKPTKQIADIRRRCDHLAGYIGRKDDPLVKLVNASKLEEIDKKADDLLSKGFTVTVFPWCPVCGMILLSGSFEQSTAINGVSQR